MTKLILSLLLLLPLSQEPKPRAIEPIRVSLAAQDEELTGDSARLRDLLREELKARRDVALVSNRLDFDVYVAATELREKGRFIGYCGAVLVVTERKRRGRLKFEIVTGPGLEHIARHIAGALDREHFQALRK